MTLFWRNNLCKCLKAAKTLGQQNYQKCKFRTFYA
jgi:hypothetical protein